MWTSMCRSGALAILVLIGSVGWSQAQPYYRAQPDARGWLPPEAAAVQGEWFFAGDRAQPCFIDVAPDGYRLVFTNEKGEQARGRLLGGGRVIAHSWGNLPGQVRGGVLYWANGSYWTR